jgi:hypothetical protein
VLGRGKSHREPITALEHGEPMFDSEVFKRLGLVVTTLGMACAAITAGGIIGVYLSRLSPASR